MTTAATIRPPNQYGTTPPLTAFSVVPPPITAMTM